jgi:hypothetical protein
VELRIHPSHVAVLVPSVKKSADYLKTFGFEIGPKEEFEETFEIYVQGQQRNSLLLMEAKESGSYRRALQKRGPGIHHLAIDVLNIEDFLHSLSGSGWLLHLNSIQSLKNYRTAYLARPGFPALIEVQEKKKLSTEGPLFVEELKLNFDVKYQSLIDDISLADFVKASTDPAQLKIQGEKIELISLF